jgi:ferredoxin-NADP reductase
MNNVDFRARVTSREVVADEVIELTLEPVDGGLAPMWSPGAHVDLVVDDQFVRQYSLVGPTTSPTQLRVSVLREAESRGGSHYIHDHVHVGSTVGVAGPRNNFALVDADRYLFVAGGIGITALLPMADAVARRGGDWELVYVGRRRESMAYVQALARFGTRVHIAPKDTHGRFDVGALLAEPREGTAVYCCGPESLLSAVEEAMASWSPGSLHTERFSPREYGEGTDGALPGFEVELRRTGVTLDVPPDKSIADVCDEHGVMIPLSCREGTCGSCETVVLEGVPAHRDSVLSQDDRASGEYIMPCVSRSCTPRLVLDL